MDWVTKIALGGGLFAVFAFVHFFVDWIFQSHAEAMVKHNNPWIRAKHCLIYTVGFVPLLWALGFTTWEWIVGLNILFWSHFFEDTYLPVYLWAKYVRRPPEMTEPRKGKMSILIDNTGACGPSQVIEEILPPDPKKGFIEFISTPLGKILMIAIDQIIHLTFLFPLVWMVIRHK